MVIFHSYVNVYQRVAIRGQLLRICRAVMPWSTKTWSSRLEDLTIRREEKSGDWKSSKWIIL